MEAPLVTMLLKWALAKIGFVFCILNFHFDGLPTFARGLEKAKGLIELRATQPDTHQGWERSGDPLGSTSTHEKYRFPPSKLSVSRIADIILCKYSTWRKCLLGAAILNLCAVGTGITLVLKNSWEDWDLVVSSAGKWRHKSYNGLTMKIAWRNFD